MPKYAKFLKGLLLNKTRLEEACTVIMNKRCSAILLNKLPSKEKDLGSFTLPCDIGHLHINNALADLGASISLMPYTMYEKLGLREPKPTRMSLELADRSIQYPRGIAENVLIKIDKFILPIDFVILNMREDSKILIILGRPFLATARAMIDVFNKKITLRVGNKEVIFDVDQSIKRPPAEDDECYGIDYLDTTIHLKTQELLEDDQLDLFLVNNLEKSLDQSDLESYGKADDGSESKTPIRHIEQVNTPYSESQETKGPDKIQNEHLYSATANEIDKKRPELKDLPSHLEYTYLKRDESCLVIISFKLTEKEKISLLRVLEKRKGAIAWKMSDIKGIRFFQIPIAPEDQEKTTFTCPYGTFAYERMPFGLCNASATFQRCMTAIFHDIVEDFMEDFMEVFMDDFSVFEGIVLGHKISRKGIEVDKAKIDVIAKLPYPRNVKSVRSFLGYAGFYRRFIKDFLMISKLMTQLLMKDAKFDFSENFYTDHPALKYLFSKQDAKPRLIRWVLLLQGFNIEIKDRKGSKNLAVDHLSRLENLNMGELAKEEIANKFLDEHLMILKAKLNDDEPWYADYVNYIVGKVVPPKWTLERRKRFFSQVKKYFWDEPYVFRLCLDNVMRRYVAGDKILEILAHCHSGPTKGHHSASVTGRKVYEVGFYWPSIFKDAKDYVMKCDECQKLGNISSRNEMP
ncbi:reverse transcriptase domain-containing protein [Tanacetum coccineum]|uniref:Reverse transcriptase domain-containing protein n=1 Tax=Tanacetum coccineum TaxID=301880 RepID=A0ABQ4YTF0_9ASTR